MRKFLGNIAGGYSTGRIFNGRKVSGGKFIGEISQGAGDFLARVEKRSDITFQKASFFNTK